MKQAIDIEQLLTWAFRDELAKRETSSAEAIWDKLADYRALAAGVDFGTRGPQRYDNGVPHVDALVIERNHLEWRLDPTSDARIPQATDHDVTWIIACQEGYSSSLAAASLQDLGLRNATDLEGGFHAWKAAGLHVG